MSHKGVFSADTLVMLELAKRPDGFSVDDIPDGMNERKVWRAAFNGHLFTIIGGSKKTKRRYFDSQERADAYYAANPLPKKIEHKKKPKTGAEMLKAAIPGKLTVKAMTGGPARLPGEPVITAYTKITIAPPPPAVLYHSNTFSRAG